MKELDFKELSSGDMIAQDENAMFMITVGAWYYLEVCEVSARGLVVTKLGAFRDLDDAKVAANQFRKEG